MTHSQDYSVYLDDRTLPYAVTCSYILYLPRTFRNVDQLRKLMTISLTMCQEIDDDEVDFDEDNEFD